MLYLGGTVLLVWKMTKVLERDPPTSQRIWKTDLILAYAPRALIPPIYHIYLLPISVHVAPFFIAWYIQVYTE